MASPLGYGLLRLGSDWCGGVAGGSGGSGGSEESLRVGREGGPVGAARMQRPPVSCIVWEECAGVHGADGLHRYRCGCCFPAEWWVAIRGARTCERGCALQRRVPHDTLVPLCFTGKRKRMTHSVPTLP